MKYLLDTNIISELRKKSPNQGLLEWISAIDSEDLYMSVITIGELRAGALKKSKKDAVQGQLLMEWVDELSSSYQDQILDLTIEDYEVWGELLAIDSMHGIDALIAAQGLQYNMTVVTTNTKHLNLFNVKLLNPFESIENNDY